MAREMLSRDRVRSELLKGVLAGATVSLLILFTVVGCARIDLPRITRSPHYPTGGPENAESAQRGAEGICSSELGEVQASLEQYAALQTLIRKASPELATQENLNAFHRRALDETRKEIVRKLRSHARLKKFASYFLRVFRTTIILSKDKTDEERGKDLKQLLGALHAREGSACASFALSRFYSNFVQALDPFSALQVDTPEAVAAAAEGPQAPVAAEPELSERPGQVAVLSIPRWDGGPSFRAFLDSVHELVSRPGRVGSLVLDLRHSIGMEPDSLGAFRLLSRELARIPALVWTDGQTRGVPELVVEEWAARRNVLVVGGGTFGFARRTCRESAVLAEGTTPVTLTFGCQEITRLDGSPHTGRSLLPHVRMMSGDAGLSGTPAEISMFWNRRRSLNIVAVPLPAAGAPWQDLVQEGQTATMDRLVDMARLWAARAPTVH